eukprot:TRINITY_DN3711_c0_g1_i1.p1 TRINITY_DN3711_c0_g1~~TRINITY_DN3711_c0_g1_i1.p1  ORF type:complete len:134 (+),score=21.50 TRINITY_DN3711_c0_g1_i1:78-479(+)
MEPALPLVSLLTNVLQRVPGLHEIIVSDRDGAIIVKVTQNEGFVKNNEEKDSLSAIFSLALDQAGKLGLGKSRSVVTFFEDKIVVQNNLYPLLMTFIGEPTLNVGFLVDIVAPDLRIALEPIRASIAAALPNL